MELTSQEFELITEYIYVQTGLRFDIKKKYIVSKRIDKRIEELKMSGFNEYFRFIKYSKINTVEFQILISELTTNETYFFRDYPLLKAFSENCLTEIISKKVLTGDNQIKIWSAGCSSGEEPYTIAIILSEILNDTQDWKIKIVASDIDQNILRKAKLGIFGNYRINEIPAEYLTKYFKVENEKYLISPGIKNMVTFENLNLLDIENMKKKNNFDFIFCRNVLIYFDAESRKQVIDSFYLALNTGGYIFLGSSESIGRITQAFTLKRMGNYLVYGKEEKK